MADLRNSNHEAMRNAQEQLEEVEMKIEMKFWKTKNEELAIGPELLIVTKEEATDAVVEAARSVRDFMWCAEGDPVHRLKKALESYDGASGRAPHA